MQELLQSKGYCKSKDTGKGRKPHADGDGNIERPDYDSSEGSGALGLKLESGSIL